MVSLALVDQFLNVGNPPFGTLIDEICNKYNLPNVFSILIGTQGVAESGGFTHRRF